MKAGTLVSAHALQGVADVTAVIERHRSLFFWLAATIGLIVTIFMPHMAFAQSGGSAASQLSSKGNDALSYVKIGAYFILIVAVIGCAILAAFGQMSWSKVGGVLIGCIVVGVAVEVVSGLSGLTSSG